MGPDCRGVSSGLQRENLKLRSGAADITGGVTGSCRDRASNTDAPLPIKLAQASPNK